MSSRLDFTINPNAFASVPTEPVSPVTREIGDIQNLLNSSSVSVNLIGTRYLVGYYGSVSMDSVAERLKIVSREFQSFNETDRINGKDCVRKMRTFYTQSDHYIIGKIRNVFDAFSAIIRLPLLLCGSYKFSLRQCIECNEFHFIGPENIKSNFSRTG